jgi:predicted transcriptional regulator
MRRSKIELYISTLEALAYNGPMKIMKITLKVRMNCSPLRAIIDDLIQKDLVEEREFGKHKVVYAATPKAKTILSHFNEFNKMLPMREAHNQPG